MSAIVSKGEFASLIGVSPARVSQMIAGGMIGRDALEGDGRFARIRVEVAKQQIGARRDPGQLVGNGAATRLGDAGGELPLGAAGDAIADDLKRERLISARLSNARAAEEALARRGVYVRADQTAAAMTRTVAKLMTIFEASLTDIASELAAEAGADRRAVLHKARAAWRKIREKAAAAARDEAAQLGPLLEDLVPDATDPALGEA